MNNLAFTALACLQLAPLTALYEVWFNGVSYPATTAILFAVGLLILSIHSIKTGETVYRYANLAGFLINSLILYKVII